MTIDVALFTMLLGGILVAFYDLARWQQ